MALNSLSSWCTDQSAQRNTRFEHQSTKFSPFHLKKKKKKPKRTTTVGFKIIVRNEFIYIRSKKHWLSIFLCHQQKYIAWSILLLPFLKDSTDTKKSEKKSKEEKENSKETRDLAWANTEGWAGGKNRQDLEGDMLTEREECGHRYRRYRLLLFSPFWCPEIGMGKT